MAYDKRGWLAAHGRQYPERGKWVMPFLGKNVVSSARPKKKRQQSQRRTASRLLRGEGFQLSTVSVQNLQHPWSSRNVFRGEARATVAVRSGAQSKHFRMTRIRGAFQEGARWLQQACCTQNQEIPLYHPAPIIHLPGVSVPLPYTARFLRHPPAELLPQLAQQRSEHSPSIL